MTEERQVAVLTTTLHRLGDIIAAMDDIRSLSPQHIRERVAALVRLDRQRGADKMLTCRLEEQAA